MSSFIDVEIDLDNYKSNIKQCYCLDNCLLGNEHNNPFEQLKDLVNTMYKNLYIYTENKLTLEQVYNDLDRILKESEIV